MVDQERPASATVRGWTSAFAPHSARLVLTGAVPAAISGVLTLAGWPAWITALFVGFGVIATSYKVWADERTLRIAAIEQRDAASEELQSRPVEGRHRKYLEGILTAFEQSVDKRVRIAPKPDASPVERERYDDFAAHFPELWGLCSEWNDAVGEFVSARKAFGVAFLRIVDGAVPSVESSVAAGTVEETMWKMVSPCVSEKLVPVPAAFTFRVTSEEPHAMWDKWNLTLSYTLPGTTGTSSATVSLVGSDPPTSVESTVVAVRTAVDRCLSAIVESDEFAAFRSAIIRRTGARDALLQRLRSQHRHEFYGRCPRCSPGLPIRNPDAPGSSGRQAVND